MNIRMGVHRRRATEEGTATSHLTGTIAIRHPHLRTHHTHHQHASRALVRQDLAQRPRAPVAFHLQRALLARPREANITETRASANIPHPQTVPRIIGKSVRVVGAAKMMRTLRLMDMPEKEDRLMEIILGLQLLLVVVLTITTTLLLLLLQVAPISLCQNPGSEPGMTWKWIAIMT